MVSPDFRKIAYYYMAAVRSFRVLQPLPGQERLV